jgi:hypothetical protein
MEGRSRAAGRWPWGFCCAIVWIVLIERLIAAHDMELATHTVWDWRQAGKAAVSQGAAAEIVCFGDSQMKEVVPQIVERGTGRSTYNLALLGGQAPASYILLRRALEAGARPRAVLVEFMPALLTKGASYNTRQWPELLTPFECIEVAWTSRDATFFAATMLGRALPSYRGRFEVRDAIAAALGGEDKSTRELNRACRRQWALNRGAQILSNEWANRQDPSAWYQANCTTGWTLEPLNAKYVRKLLDLADDRNIPVFWLLPPIHPEAQDRCDRGGYDAAVERFVGKALARYPNLVVLDARRSGYGPAIFTDIVHLNRKGSCALSEAVASAIASRLNSKIDAARWVALPMYHESPTSVPIEDLGESLTIAKWHPPARR